MEKKNRLIVMGCVVGVLALVAIYMAFGGSTTKLTDKDIKNLETLESAAQADKATSPPPQTFAEPPKVTPLPGSRSK